MAIPGWAPNLVFGAESGSHRPISTGTPTASKILEVFGQRYAECQDAHRFSSEGETGGMGIPGTHQSDRTGRLRLRVLAAVAVAALAGCGDDSEERVQGTGYSYSVPDGWKDVSAEAMNEPSVEIAGIRPDSAVVGERDAGFATNVNVIREGNLPAGTTAREYAEASIAGVRDPRAAGYPPELVETFERMRPRQISEARDAELGGENAASWSYVSTQGGRVLRVWQIAAVMHGSGYTVTLTALPQQAEAGKAALDEVVESWEWD
jgi:hypothetical protein